MADIQLRFRSQENIAVVVYFIFTYVSFIFIACKILRCCNLISLLLLTLILWNIKCFISSCSHFNVLFLSLAMMVFIQNTDFNWVNFVKNQKIIFDLNRIQSFRRINNYGIRNKIRQSILGMMTNWMTYCWLIAGWLLADCWLTAGWLTDCDCLKSMWSYLA